ncbi:MAG: urease accessory protein UreD [Opitutaceae bacterium]|nr:urease accessory protein UreD [Opitutaceae bacterium]
MNPDGLAQTQVAYGRVSAFAGHLSLTAARGADGATFLKSQSFRAPFHLSKPHWEGRVLIVQVVNPTAGILAGDELRMDLRVTEGASLLVSTPSASRVFTMPSGSAVSRQSVQVQAGAWLEYAPEPLVPHARSCFLQHTVLEVEPGGGLLWTDGLMPGRLGRGEAWSWTRLVLDLTVRCGAELLLRERLDESGASLKRLATLAGSGDGACFANWVLVAPQAGTDPSWMGDLNALQREGVRIGVSTLRGCAHAWTVRFVASDSIALREITAAARRRLSVLIPPLHASVRKF